MRSVGHSAKLPTPLLRLPGALHGPSGQWLLIVYTYVHTYVVEVCVYIFVQGRMFKFQPHLFHCIISLLIVEND